MFGPLDSVPEHGDGARWLGHRGLRQRDVAAEEAERLHRRLRLAVQGRAVHEVGVAVDARTDEAQVGVDRPVQGL